MNGYATSLVYDRIVFKIRKQPGKKNASPRAMPIALAPARFSGVITINSHRPETAEKITSFQIGTRQNGNRRERNDKLREGWCFDDSSTIAIRHIDRR